MFLCRKMLITVDGNCLVLQRDTTVCNRRGTNCGGEERIDWHKITDVSDQHSAYILRTDNCSDSRAVPAADTLTLCFNVSVFQTNCLNLYTSYCSTVLLWQHIMLCCGAVARCASYDAHLATAP